MYSVTSLLVFVRHDLAAISTIVIGQVQIVNVTSFFSRMVVKNIDAVHRVQFDTIQMTGNRVGKCLGATLAYLFPLSFSMETNYLISIGCTKCVIFVYFILFRCKILKY